MKLGQIPLVVIATTCGWLGAWFWPHPKPSAPERQVVGYQSPMHPWVKSDKPGQCTVCGMDLVPMYAGEKGFAHSAAGIVMLAQETANMGALKTEEVKKQPLARTLRVAGVIGEDESRHGIISAPVEGRIDGLAMSCEGDTMTRRQPLATIFSRTLLAAADDYKLALAQGGAPVDQARRRLEQYGLVWEQISAIPHRQPDDIYFGILAPLTGTIIKSFVSEGQCVQAGDKLFEIADFTQMWFVFSAYEQDLPLIQKGQLVTLELPSLPGQSLKARVSFISPTLDQTTRSAHVRVVLENADRRLRNRTYATASVEIEAPEVVAIPRSAVLWPGTQPRVYVEKGTGLYEQRQVKLGRAGDRCWEVIEGLQEGERVVSIGNMLLDGQAQLDALQSGQP